MSSGSSSSGSASSCLGWVCGHLLGLRSLSGSWSVVCPGGFCGHVRSVVIFWVGDHFLDRGLWSCHESICGHLLGLWSFPGSWAVVISWVGLCSSSGSVVISWIGRGLWSCPEWSVVIFWVCGHSLDRGLLRVWSCPGWVCGHLLGLWSLSGSWYVRIQGIMRFQGTKSGVSQNPVYHIGN